MLFAALDQNEMDELKTRRDKTAASIHSNFLNIKDNGYVIDEKTRTAYITKLHNRILKSV